MKKTLENSHDTHDHEHAHADHCHDSHNHEHAHADHCHDSHDHEHAHTDHDHCHDTHHHEHTHTDHDHKHDTHHHGHTHTDHDHQHDTHDHEHTHTDHNHCHDDHCCCDHDHDTIHEHTHADHSAADTIKEFDLEGIDCPHCAGQIETELLSKNGIVSAEINLITNRLTLGLSSDYSGDIFTEAVNAVKKFEPDADIITGGSKAEKSTKPSLKKLLSSDKAMYIRFGLGAALFAVGFLLSLLNMSVYVYFPVLIVSYIILGFDVVFGALRNIMSGRIFDEKFLMTVSTVGAFAIGEYPEAVAVMLFYQIGEFFQSLAVRRSRRSISELMELRPDKAVVERNGKLVEVSPETVRVGEIIAVKPGEKIPLDGEVIEGESMLDTRALTGESVPRAARPGDSALSGCISETGMIKLRVTKPFGESTASKILELVENAAGRKAPTENFISVFARYYTPVVVILAAILAVVPPLVLGGGWTMWIRRCFVFLVISCPCALVISIPLSFFGGIGAASRRGILVKGSGCLEALAAVDTVVLDKTGTLTKGVFKVTKLIPENGTSESELLRYAAAAEKNSNHPIARSIFSAYTDGEIPEIHGYKEISGHGVSAEISGTGEKLLAGSFKLMQDNNVKCKEVSDPGTLVYIARNKKYLGCLVISDEIKDDSKAAISRLQTLGINRTVMLTGDTEVSAKSVGDQLGIGEYHASLLPGDKVELVEKLLDEESEKSKLAFVGDGINDAPVLARADVGIAMGALGSDAAIEAADVVLMNDSPTSIAEAVTIARRTKRIVTQNIVIVLLAKLLILTLGALGIAGMWWAVFGDVGVMIIAVLNSMRIMRNE